jgi:hypothetical protein
MQRPSQKLYMKTGLAIEQDSDSQLMAFSKSAFVPQVHGGHAWTASTQTK